MKNRGQDEKCRHPAPLERKLSILVPLEERALLVFAIAVWSSLWPYLSWEVAKIGQFYVIYGMYCYWFAHLDKHSGKPPAFFTYTLKEFQMGKNPPL